MNIEDALKEKHAHYYVVQLSVTSPHRDKASWGDSTDWRAELTHSDGQYGGGKITGRGPTMEAAIDDCVRQFHEAIERLYPKRS